MRNVFEEADAVLCDGCRNLGRRWGCAVFCLSSAGGRSRLHDHALRVGIDQERNAGGEFGSRQRCLEVEKRNRGKLGGLSALFLAATRGSKSEAGKEAHRLLGSYIETADIGDLATAFDYGILGDWRSLEGHAPAFLARARQNPEHPKSPRLLTAVCSATRPDEDGTPPPIFVEAANLIADKYAASPEVANFCFSLQAGDPWTAPFERHLAPF